MLYANYYISIIYYGSRNRSVPFIIISIFNLYLLSESLNLERLYDSSKGHEIRPGSKTLENQNNLPNHSVNMYRSTIVFLCAYRNDIILRTHTSGLHSHEKLYLKCISPIQENYVSFNKSSNLVNPIFKIEHGLYKVEYNLALDKNWFIRSNISLINPNIRNIFSNV